VQVQLQALGSTASQQAPALAGELNRLAHILRDETIGLRDVMQRHAPPELAPEKLIDTLSDAIHRFRCETGVMTRFVTCLDRLALSPRGCREVVHIVQEALVNVRKHSGAATVTVRLGVEHGVARLEIEDDGRGFPQPGRCAHDDLATALHRPRVILERVRLLGGQMAVESDPEQGARLVILIPLLHV
jgi:two-component system, NarL family, nitrate/nitrite sensor histidine kinase NarX